MFGSSIGRATSLAIAVLFVMGLAFTLTAGEPIPFRGGADAVVIGAEPVPGGLLLGVAATGQATHLGQFTREENVVLYADGTAEGTLVFIAANGDRLYADVEGGFISPTTLIGSYTFTGGTGRFATATGTVDFVGVTTDGIHLALTFGGNIAY